MAEEVKRWRGDMEAFYIYTAGVAGERFLRELRNNERLMGTYCPRCDVTYLPPRIYCEVCFTELSEWEEVPNKGVIDAFTVAYVNDKGEKLPQPLVWALVRYPGVRGGLLHFVNLPAEEVYEGMEVEAVFKRRGDREASITDILYLKPI